MTVRYGTNYAKTIAFPPDKISTAESFGKLYSSYDEYNLNGTALATGDLIYMMKIPVGAILVNAVLLSSAVNGITIAVGQIAPGQLEDGAGTSVANIIPATAVTTTPVIAQMTTAITATSFHLLKVTSEMQIGIKATVGAAGTTGLIKLMVIYAMS